MFFCVPFSFEIQFLTFFANRLQILSRVPWSILLLTDWYVLLLTVWRSEENLQELILSYYMGSGTQTQVLRLGCRHLYPLSHLAGPQHVLTMEKLVKAVLQNQELGQSRVEKGRHEGSLWLSTGSAWESSRRGESTLSSTGTCFLITALLRVPPLCG